MVIIARYQLEKLERKVQPNPNPWAGRDVYGYGRKIPTQYMVRVPGYGKRWRRVWCCQTSNAGTCYVAVNKGQDWIVVW